jgi:hypothetical protein
MRTGFSRVGAIAFCVLTLLATATPAHARTTLLIKYVARITIPGGKGYPMTTLPTPAPTILVGSPLQTIAHLVGGAHPQSNCLPLPTPVPDQCLTNSHWTFDHVRQIRVTSVMCTSTTLTVNKPDTPPMHTGACTFTSIEVPGKPNTVSGHCGLSSGQVQILFTDALGENYRFDLHFKATNVIIITGHVSKLGSSQRGLFVSVANAVPEPRDNQSCTTKSQEDFLVVGTAAVDPLSG